MTEQKTKIPELRFRGFSGAWEEKKLGDIASKITNRNGSSSADIVLTNSAVYGVIPQTEFFDKEIAVQGNLLNYYVTEKDDFIYNPRISVSAPVGPFKRNHFGAGVMSPLYNLYRFHKGEVLDYFEQYLSATYWHKYMKDVANYGARSDRMAISNSDLLGLPFPYPSKKEQEKIAGFLTVVDERLQLIEKRVELLKKYKKGIMQKIFPTKVGQAPQIRFRDENGQNYPDWQEKRLDEICSNFMVPMRDKPKDLTGSTPWCRIEDFDGKYLTKSKSGQGVTKEEIDRVRLTVFPKDTLIVSCSANLGESAIAGVELVTNQTFIGLTVNQLNDLDFVYHLMRYSKHRLNVLSSGTTISYLSREGFEKLKVLIPSKDEQTKIADFLSSIDDKIKLEETKLEQAKLFKKSLLQRMFV